MRDLLPDGGVDDEDEEHSQEEGEEDAQNDLFVAGQQPIHCVRERETCFSFVSSFVDLSSVLS